MRRLPGLNRRRAVLAGLLAVVMSMGATAAWAYWLTSGVGSGSATTGSLAAPTNPTATYASGATDVTVSWTASVGSPTPTGYFVTRIRTSDSATSPACGTSAATTTTAFTCTDATVPDGTYRYTVTAVYRSWTATSLLSNTVTVLAATSTTTALSSSSNPSVFGQTVTYTAMVTPSASTGTVTFKDGTTTIACTGGTQTLTGGQATCSLAYNAVGSHSITAVYNGDATHLTSTSVTLSQTVNQASTSTTLVANPTSSVTGQSVTLTATVAVSSPGSGTPTGTVTFSNGATVLCNAVALNGSGVAACATTALPVGNKTLSAVYSGSATLVTSTGTTTQTTTAASTTTALGSSAPNGIGTGATVTYTATVSATAPGSGVPTGTVTFKDGASTISCAGGTQTLNGSGVATCQVSYPSISTHPITAVYAGTTSYLTSTSAVVTQKVVNPNVTGIRFTNLTMSSGTLTCTGAGSANYSCSIVNSSHNATVAAQVSFVDSSGNLVAYSADAETVTVVYTGGKNPGANSLTVAAGATTSSAAPAPSISRNGNNNAQMTFTFTLSGGQTVTATVTIS